MPNAQRRNGFAAHAGVSEDQEDRDVARPAPSLGRIDQGVHDVRPGHLRGRLTMMGWSIEMFDRICGEQLPLYQKRAQTRQRALSIPVTTRANTWLSREASSFARSWVGAFGDAQLVRNRRVEVLIRAANLTDTDTIDPGPTLESCSEPSSRGAEPR